MPALATLTEFIESAGYRLHSFDMGRRIIELPRETLLKFEHTEEPYPLPLQQQAWMGSLLLRDNIRMADPLVWFIRLPLDEQGKLVLSARDEFLHRLLESLGNNLDPGQASGKLQAALEDNPYTYRPKEERLAILHAKATRLLDQAPSRYYNHALEYFSGAIGWEQWSFLGFQGIADLAVRQGDGTNPQQLAAAIPQLPPAPLEALCHCLENEPIADEIAQALATKAELTLTKEEPNLQNLTACLRGISRSHAVELKRRVVWQVLNHDLARRNDVLAAIGGRAWEVLLDDRIRGRYLVCLAENDQGQVFFDNMLSDLLFLPATRSTMLNSLRNENRPARLAKAIGKFFSHLQQT